MHQFIAAVWTLLQERRTDSAANSAQEGLNAVWDLIFDLPVYRRLRLDAETARNLFPTLAPASTPAKEPIRAPLKPHRRPMAGWIRPRA